MRTVATIALACCSGLLAQTPTPRPEFEVATIKPNSEGKTSSSFGSRSPGTMYADNAQLRMLIQDAYNVRSFQIQGLPSWADSDRFNMNAKARVDSNGGPVNSRTIREAFVEMRLMLQSLLEERFNLKVHYETKDMPVYILTVAKGGLKLQESDCFEFDRDNPQPPPEPGKAPRQGCGNTNMNSKEGNRTMNASGIRLKDLSGQLLADVTGRIVLDKTGTDKKFDMRLEWSPGLTSDALAKPGAGPDDAPRAIESQGQSLFSALQGVGLKLESGRGPVQILVIDHIEKLTSN